MKFPKRFRLFLTGFGIGLLLSYAWLVKDRKRISWFPSARVMMHIEDEKVKLLYSDSAMMQIKRLKIDTPLIDSLFLQTADVDFGKGAPRKKPCATYVANFTDEDSRQIEVVLKSCKTYVTVQKVSLYKED